MAGDGTTAQALDNGVAGAQLGGAADFVALLKPRVMSLVVFTGLVGLMLAPNSALHPFEAAVAVLCIAVGAGAAGAINMWYDRDIDALMSRTKDRPIPSGAVNADEALAFGIVLSIASVVTMALVANLAAGALLAFSILFYVLIYTMWLKRSTAQNIVIGGAAGAFPPAIGWAAATGEVGLAAIVLFLIVFMWTPPHFWALSLWAHGDYARAKVPMLPVTAGPRETRRQILLYTLALVPLTLSPWFVGFAGLPYAAAAAVLGAVFLWHAVRVLREAQDETGRSLVNDLAARATFRYSLYYLFVLFGALALDRLAF